MMDSREKQGLVSGDDVAGPMRCQGCFNDSATRRRVTRKEGEVNKFYDLDKMGICIKMTVKLLLANRHGLDQGLLALGRTVDTLALWRSGNWSLLLVLR